MTKQHPILSETPRILGGVLLLLGITYVYTHAIVWAANNVQQNHFPVYPPRACYL